MKLFTAVGIPVEVTFVWKFEKLWIPVYFIKEVLVLPQGDFFKKWIDLCDNIGVKHFKAFKPQENFINIEGVQLILKAKEGVLSKKEQGFQKWLSDNLIYINLIKQYNSNCVLSVPSCNTYLNVFNDEEKYIIVATHIDNDKMAWFELKKIMSLFNYKNSASFTKLLKSNQVKKWKELGSTAGFQLFPENELLSEEALKMLLVMPTKDLCSFKFKNWIINTVIPGTYERKYAFKRSSNEVSTQTAKKTKLYNEMLDSIKSELDATFKNFNSMIRALNKDLCNKFINVENVEENLLENTLHVFKLKNNEYKFCKRQKRAIPQMMKDLDEKALLIYSKSNICNNLDIIKSVKLFLNKYIINNNKHSIWMNIQIPVLNAVLDKICDNQELIMDILQSKKDDEQEAAVCTELLPETLQHLPMPLGQTIPVPELEILKQMVEKTPKTLPVPLKQELETLLEPEISPEPLKQELKQMVEKTLPEICDPLEICETVYLV
ncbi:hypothetical protein TNCT_20701 [Trichonephila clavata]|uniref:Bro-N domain-containing protein n=1 Tax=Trichonephila clavata TaxID=2740835 RepID=A0A8X6KNG0_TRICU|nr:hypothetical protein TNCT_20701 [Trichonephila clavata]